MKVLLPLALLLLLPLPAEALRVTGQGPRSGAAAAAVRAAFRDAGIKRATVKVRVRRRPGAWQVTIQVFKTGSRRAAVTRVLRARHGRVSTSAAARVARAAARALRVGKRTRRRPRRVARRRRRRPVPVRVVKADPPAPKAPADPDPPAAPKPAPAPTPAPAPKPAPRKTTAAMLGFETAGGSGARDDARDEPRPTRRARRVARARDDDPPRTRRRSRDDDEPTRTSPRVRRRRRYKRNDVDPLLTFGVGLSLAWKSHTLETPGAPTRYTSGAHSQFAMATEFFPFRLTKVSALSWLGIRFRFLHSAGLSTATKDPTSGAAKDVGTSVNCYWAGFVGRIPRWRGRYAPLFSLHFGLALNDFSLHEQTDIQDFLINELGAGGSVLMPIHRYVRFRVSAEYRVLVGADSDQLNQHRISVGSAQGLQFEAEVSGRIIFGLGYRAAFSFERVSGIVEPLSATGSQLDLEDKLITVGLMLTYEV